MKTIMQRIGIVGLLFTSVSLLVLTGCEKPAKALRQVTDWSQNGEVAIIPETRGRWIVRKPDGSVWYVVDHGIYDKPHDATQLLKPTK